MRGQLIDLALEQPELSPHELAVTFTDETSLWILRKRQHIHAVAGNFEPGRRSMEFPALLDTFARAIERRDGNGLADLFTDDGVYDDYFFGVSKPGRAGICETVNHFYSGGTNYRWEFFSPLASDRLGYASYWFSYDSTLPEASGARVVFEGISRFELEGDRIKRYSEVFDRGMALAQVGFTPERLKKIGLRYADELKRAPAARPHLEDR
jgi:hypothetical protein